MGNGVLEVKMNTLETGMTNVCEDGVAQRTRKVNVCQFVWIGSLRMSVQMFIHKLCFLLQMERTLIDFVTFEQWSMTLFLQSCME